MQTPRQVLSAEMNVKIDTNNITATLTFESEDGRVAFSLTNHETSALINLLIGYGVSIQEDIKAKNEDLERQAFRRMRQARNERTHNAAGVPLDKLPFES